MPEQGCVWNAIGVELVNGRRFCAKHMPPVIRWAGHKEGADVAFLSGQHPVKCDGEHAHA